MEDKYRSFPEYLYEKMQEENERLIDQNRGFRDLNQRLIDEIRRLKIELELELAKQIDLYKEALDNQSYILYLQNEIQRLRNENERLKDQNEE